MLQISLDPTVPGSFADYNAIPLKKREEVKVRDDADRAEWIYTLLETNIDTRNDVFLMYLLPKMAILGIHVRFRGCIAFKKIWGGNGALVGKVCVLVYVVKEHL